MDSQAKKVAAALAAVNLFIDDEALGERPEHREGGLSGLSIWSLSGRQAIMNARFLVTARMWK